MDIERNYLLNWHVDIRHYLHRYMTRIQSITLAKDLRQIANETATALGKLPEKLCSRTEFRAEFRALN